MPKERKRYTAEFKAKIALEVIKANRTLNELAREYEVHPNQLVQWKRQLLESLPSIFADKRSKGEKEQENKEAELYQQIGQLKVELAPRDSLINVKREVDANQDSSQCGEKKWSKPRPGFCEQRRPMQVFLLCLDQ